MVEIVQTDKYVRARGFQLAADIITARVSHNYVAVDELPNADRSRLRVAGRIGLGAGRDRRTAHAGSLDSSVG